MLRGPQQGHSRRGRRLAGGRAGGSRDRVRDAAAVVGELILDDSVGEAALRTALAGRYRVIRPFLVLLAQALPLVTAPARQKILVPRTVRETAALELSDTPASQHVFQAVAACREGVPVTTDPSVPLQRPVS